MSQQKRKRVVPTIQQKIDIIKQLDEGASVKELAIKYNIGCTTVHDIKKNRDKLLRFSMVTSDSIFGIQNRRSMKKSPYELLNKAMLQWFNSERAKGRSVNGPMCVKQAKLLFETLGMKGNFDASSGWLARFKDRHGIRTVGESMECLWTKTNTEKILSSDESNHLGNIQQEEIPLNGCLELSRNNNSFNSEATISAKSQESSFQNNNDDDDGASLCAPAINDENLMEENMVDYKNSNSNKNNINLADLISAVNKLETISEKITACDSYDQFGTYITSLLRDLPQHKSLILKQRITNYVLDAIIAHEKGLDENSLYLADFNMPVINECPVTKLQKPSFPLEYCNTSEKSGLPVSVNKRQSIDCVKSDVPAVSPTASSLLAKPCVATSNPDIHHSDNAPCSGHFQTIKRAKKRKTMRQITSESSNKGTCSISDVDHCMSGMVKKSPVEDLTTDIEEGKEPRQLKENEELFEAVFCEDILFVQVKDEPPDPDLESSPSIAQSILCDLCEVPCTSSTELMLHFTKMHPGCVPTCRAQFEESIT